MRNDHLIRQKTQTLTRYQVQTRTLGPPQTSSMVTVVDPLKERRQQANLRQALQIISIEKTSLTAQKFPELVHRF